MIVTYDNQANQVSQNRRLVPKHLREVAASGDRDGSSDNGGFTPEPSDIEFFRESRQHLATGPTESQATDEATAEKLESLCFDFDTPPPKPPPILSIAGRTIATEGNISTISAQAKAGKSALVQALLASRLTDDKMLDLLGVDALGIPDGAVLHFDSEQSKYDHDALIRRTIARADCPRPPEWFKSYWITPLSRAERRIAVFTAVRRIVRDGRRVELLILDGGADLLNSVNDEAESFNFVAELQQLAIFMRGHISTVIHENASVKDVTKMRGHFGSEAERKAEANIKLAKDVDEISTIYAERNRGGAIPKATGPRFAWSDAAMMHKAVLSAREQEMDSKRDLWIAELDQVFKTPEDALGLKFGELVRRIKPVAGVKDRAAEGRVKSYTCAGLVRKNADGNYIRNIFSQ